MKKIGLSLAFVAVCALLTACGEAETDSSEESKEYTEEDLKNDIGKVIETDFDYARKILLRIDNCKFAVYGYSANKSEVSSFGGVTVYSIDLVDGEDILGASITENAYNAVEEGKMAYAYGEIGYSDYSDYGIDELENKATIYCYSNGCYISYDEIPDAMTISDYTKTVKKIFEDTYIQTNGYVIQDNDKYKLYSSKDSYNESELGYIELEFADEQSYLTGKTITVIGKPDSSAGNTYSLVDCNIIE